MAVFRLAGGQVLDSLKLVENTRDLEETRETSDNKYAREVLGERGYVKRIRALKDIDYYSELARRLGLD